MSGGKPLRQSKEEMCPKGPEHSQMRKKKTKGAGQMVLVILVILWANNYSEPPFFFLTVVGNYVVQKGEPLGAQWRKH